MFVHKALDGFNHVRICHGHVCTYSHLKSIRVPFILIPCAMFHRPFVALAAAAAAPTPPAAVYTSRHLPRAAFSSLPSFWPASSTRALAAASASATSRRRGGSSVLPHGAASPAGPFGAPWHRGAFKSARVALRKRFGQHLLKNPDVARRIVAEARVQPHERVLEIGPGTGNMTVPLLEQAAAVFAVELDPQMYEAVTARVKQL